MRTRYRSTALLACFCTVLLIGCAAKTPITSEKDADSLFSSATDLQQSEDYAGAEAKFKAFMAKYPESDRADNAQLAIGHTQYYRGEYKAAIEAYRLVPRDGDVADEASLAVGDAYLALGEVEQARAAYQGLLEKYPYLNDPQAQQAQEHLDAIDDLEAAAEDLRVASPESRDNAQFYLADIYFSTFQDYSRSIREFEKVYIDYPNSELADDAMWMVGESYWARASEYVTSEKISREQQAYVRLHRMIDVYPQLVGLMGPKVGIKPHWPAGRRGDRYELYYAESRRLLNRFPTLKDRVYSDFLDPDYQAALGIWDELMRKYPNSDAAAQAPEKMAVHLVDLGKLYYNLGLADFSSVLMRESMRFMPLPEAHIYLAYYYADARTHVRSTYYLTRSFQHIGEAQKLVPPDSNLASDLKQLKSWMNYRMRLEALEALYYSKLGKQQ